MTDHAQDLVERALALTEKRTDAAAMLLVAASYIFIDDLGAKDAAEFWEKYTSDILASIKGDTLAATCRDGTSDAPLPWPAIEQVEDALDRAVTALVAYRHDRPARRGPPTTDALELISAGQLLATDRRVLEARDLVGSPVTVGLKHSIRKLGNLAHQMVGDAGMHDLAERVCNRDEPNWSRRMSPIDSAWNGIGSWFS